MSMSGQGTWVVHSIEHPNVNFGSGLDPKIMGLSSTLGTLNVEPA